MRNLKPFLTLAILLGCATFHDDTGWAPQSAPDADPKAQALIDDVWKAMGVLPAFQTRGELRFTFNYYDEGSLKKTQVFYWNRFERRIRSEEDSAEGQMLAVRADIVKHTGKAYMSKRKVGGNDPRQRDTQAASQRENQDSQFEPLPTSEFARLEASAFKSFLMARRWLLGMVTLRDPGVHVKLEADEAAPDKKVYPALHVTFDDKADVEDKSDQVWWLIDPETHQPAWMLWQKKGQEGKSAWSQEDFQDAGGGLKLPLTHKQFGSQVEIKFVNVQLNPRPDDDLYFERLK